MESSRERTTAEGRAPECLRLLLCDGSDHR